jgi:sialate O-acetylesterase
VRDFSAVGYYFGRDLAADLKVPVGIIHTSWGGSPAEAWMSMGTLRRNHVYNRDILDTASRERRNYELSLAAWRKEKAETEAKGEKFTKYQPWPPWSPAELYNGMLLPIAPYGIKGAIWYQGESNAGRAWQYRNLFADMITDWRKVWQQGDFPFYAVQLAPWDKGRKRSLQEITAKPGDSDWAELRESQNHVARTLKNVKTAVITDVGDKDDIHPTKKLPVGHRLALLAEKNLYGLKVIDHGPDLGDVSFQGKELRLRFDNVGNGLKTLDGGAPTGFAVAGADGVYQWADAKIINKNELILTSAAVPEPKTVRYGWADFPVVNLANSADLPASPFRTDNAVWTTSIIR